MASLLLTLDKLRSSDLPVLISGETGAGKEMVARIIHAESRRGSGPFVVVDCAAIPDSIIEAELFGARAGAFTDMTEDRPGLLTQAEGGTVLFDEIGAASGEMQGKLLRLLSEGTLRAVGADRESRADVRCLFSTARNLEEDSRGGAFRSDLFHRIRVFPVKVPPLRERRLDIDGLVEQILLEGTEGAGTGPRVEPAAMERLRNLPWPGNVRQLRNLLLRLRVEQPTWIGLDDLERDLPGARDAPALPEGLLEEHGLAELRAKVEREYILHHLRRTRGDMKALSRHLGLSLKHCYRLCRDLGIRLREERRQRGQ